MAPVIGISGSSADSQSVKAMMAQIAATSATPLLLSNHSRRTAAEDIAKIDALIVMGNNSDIDPARYGEARHAKTNVETDTPEGKARAEYEYALLEAAIAAKMPTLGVCAGMQRINVLCGGSLHQHVPDLVGHNEHAQQDYKIEGYIPVQPVFLGKGSTLSEIASGITAVYTPGRNAPPPLLLMENSMHHQAVNVVGEGLRAAAFSDDEVPLAGGGKTQMIEAIEADPNGKFAGQTLMGVQWHPEFGASPLGARLAGFMAEKAQAYAAQQNRTHDEKEAPRETMLSSLPQNIPAPRPGSLTDMVLRRRYAPEASTGLAV